MTTGWPPGLLQDDSRKLSDWFASRVDAKYTVRQVCAEIEEKRKMNLTKPTQPFTEPRGNKSESRIKVEQILAEYTPKGGISIPRIAELAEIDESTVRKALAPLRDAQQLVNVGRPRIPVYLWMKEQPLKKAEPIRYVPRGSYDGAELRPYEGRPGAMDAYSKPSLRDGVLVPYNGIRPMLVGSLKDSSNNAR